MSLRAPAFGVPLVLASLAGLAQTAPRGPLPPAAATQPSPAVQRAQKAALLRDAMQKDALQRSFDHASKQSIRDRTSDPATARQVDAADQAEQRAYEDRQRRRAQDLILLENGAPAPATSTGDGGPR
ncbi:MAG TPA: hypothetical protein VF216_13135 [Mizugakiibacter sp.]|uniref:DUF4148 domain-containing protein n=2 Tax=Mizugakiibacter sediminis TaxID=1475481 RepID=A0A0K8QLZ4_9GAMM|nr:hypothetical protein MBSD_n1247 [Mizugakiibacter sediminis]